MQEHYMRKVVMTKAITWTKVQAIIYSIVFSAIGLLAGIFLQKYYPIGSLLRTVGIPYKSMPTLPHRSEVPVNVLPGRRVMIAIVFGQSNSSNFGETRRTTKERVYNFYRGKLYLAQDPLLGADGNGGSVWTRLGDKLIAQNIYDAVVFVPLGVRRAEITRWKSGGDLHLRILDAINELEMEHLTPTHLLWHQGEYDAELGTSGNEYKKMFLDMLSSIRDRGIIAPIYASVATKCGCDYGYTTIQRAQEELVNRDIGIRQGPNTDILGFNYRYDRCHFSNEGLDKVAELWLESLKQ